MALQDNNLMLLDLDPASNAYGMPRTIDTGSDTIAVGVDTTFAQDLSVGGNLTVTGDIISGGTMDVVVTDNFIDLSNGQGNGANKSGGLTVNVQTTIARVNAQNAVFESQASAAGPFATLSIAAFDPSTGGVGGGPIADGDIIEIAGCADLAGNNGLFVVESAAIGAGGLIEIKNASQTQTPFAQTNFETGTETAAAASFAPAVDLGVFCISDGVMQDVLTNPIPVGQFVSAFQVAAKISTLKYEAAANVSLQEAYNVGQTILLSDAKADLQIRTDDTGPRADFQLTNEGATADFLKTGAGLLTIGSGTANKVALSGQVSTDITFDGVGGRSIQQTGQGLALKTLTAGDIDLQAANSLDMIASGGIPNSRWSLSGQNLQADCPIFASFNDAADREIVIGAANTGAGNADINIGDTTNVRMSRMMANAELVLDSAGLLNMTSGSPLAASAFNAAARMGAQNGGATVYGSTNTLIVADANGLELRSNGLGVDIVSSGADINLTSTNNQIVGLAQSGIDLLATTGGFSIDSTAGASNVTANAADLTLATTASGDVVVSSAVKITGTAATDATLTSTAGTAKLEALAGAATVTGTGKVTLASSAADMDIDGATGVAINSGSNDVIVTAFNNARMIATNGDASVTALGGGMNASLIANQGTAVMQGQVATVTSTNGGVTVDMQHAGSRMDILSSGNAATDAIDIHASGGGAKLRSAGDLAISSSANNVSVSASAGQIAIHSRDLLSLRTTAAGELITIESQQAAVILSTGVGIAAGGAIIVDGHLGIQQTGAGAGYTGVATAAIAAGQVCSIPAAGATEDVEVAARTSANIPVGLALIAAAAASDPVAMHTVHGVPVQTATAAAAGDVGKLMYLDAAGAMTFIAPIASGDYVWRLGTCIGVNGGNALMVWAPQFVAKRP